MSGCRLNFFGSWLDRPREAVVQSRECLNFLGSAGGSVQGLVEPPGAKTQSFSSPGRQNVPKTIPKCTTQKLNHPSPSLLLPASLPSSPLSISPLPPLPSPSPTGRQNDPKMHPFQQTQSCTSLLGGDEHALWLTTNEGPECVPAGRHRIPNQRKDAAGPSSGPTRTRRPKPDGTAGANCLAHQDKQGAHAQKCLMEGDRAKLWVVTSYTMTWTTGQGGAQASQVQRLSARAMQNPRDTELWAISQRACAFMPCQVPKILHSLLYLG